MYVNECFSSNCAIIELNVHVLTTVFGRDSLNMAIVKCPDKLIYSLFVLDKKYNNNIITVLDF